MKLSLEDKNWKEFELGQIFEIERGKRLIEKDRLIKEDPKSAEIIKPFLAGKDIKRYMPPQSHKYLILFQKGWTNSQGNFNSESEALNFLQKNIQLLPII
jgi:hypothetical protein